MLAFLVRFALAVGISLADRAAEPPDPLEAVVAAALDGAGMSCEYALEGPEVRTVAATLGRAERAALDALPGLGLTYKIPPGLMIEPPSDLDLTLPDGKTLQGRHVGPILAEAPDGRLAAIQLIEVRGSGECRICPCRVRLDKEPGRRWDPDLTAAWVDRVAERAAEGRP